MVIAKKPLSNSKNIALTDLIISKGGTAPSDTLCNENTNIKITIRLSAKMLNIIDQYLETSISKKTRTCWLREAIEEKINKDILCRSE